MVVPAGGCGQRFDTSMPKQYTRMGAHTLLWHTLNRLLSHEAISQVILAVSPDDAYFEQSDVAAMDWPIERVNGGETRAHSVLNGLRALTSRLDDQDLVLVHDACRPCVDHVDISALIDAVASDAVGGLLAKPSTDTLKHVKHGQVLRTLDRQTIWRAQTPQMFRFRLLYDALGEALSQGVPITDESSAVEYRGLQPKIVEARGDNIKITYPADLLVAMQLLTQE